MAASLAEQAGVTIVCEPLNKKESNIINSVAEGIEYVKELNHPNFQCLVDRLSLLAREGAAEESRSRHAVD